MGQYQRWIPSLPRLARSPPIVTHRTVLAQLVIKTPHKRNMEEELGPSTYPTPTSSPASLPRPPQPGIQGPIPSSQQVCGAAALAPCPASCVRFPLNTPQPRARSNVPCPGAASHRIASTSKPTPRVRPLACCRIGRQTSHRRPLLERAAPCPRLITISFHMPPP